ncbi:N-acetylmuramoyl-L-alanine amidase LytC precursor [Corynebacterium faecale]|uniref:N-acetylmuramoyl-L-alanine amidase n=1 Tax=Corynebacterium faecale TaxID=1758466 RepID=UPI0025B4DCDE|nr:N-acetylmuramoyl-L-alanine amidase [Corynebacterium faecale]WJY93501.1 N-acetylmuramoyl-L-alanine amidase LytC precursor [Corynebacterium faecale]
MSDVLRVGARSPRVAEVRHTLARLGVIEGYTRDMSAKTESRKYHEEDTFFDDVLSNHLKAFQQARGIIPSGEIDQLTLRVLREASYTLGARVLSYQPGNHLVGDDVVEVQTHLHELGFYTERIDGRFGEHTHRAVMDYQLNYGMQVDGICGPDTIRALGRLGLRIKGGSANAIHERERVRNAGPRLTGKRVVIDPALGGANKGQIVQGPFGEISEAEILWDLATRLEGRMIATGVETILSRPHMDDPTPADRASIANAFGADLTLSLQCDSYPNDKANGVATFYFGSEAGTSSLTGETLSSYIQKEIVARTPLSGCGSHARTWEMLRLTRMPTVEIVTGYLTNPQDLATLTDPAMRDQIAEAIVVAVKRLYLLDEDEQPKTGTFKFSELLKSETE